MFKDLLEEKKMSIYKLAKVSGVSYTAINELYRGERTVDECKGKTLKLLADALNISLDYLYQKSQERNKIPSSLYKCFWDVNPKDLDLEKDKIYIISRLLTHGGYEGFIYLNKTYNYEDFKDVGLKSRQLTPKIANFLCLNFKLKREDMRFYKTNIDWRKLCI